MTRAIAAALFLWLCAGAGLSPAAAQDCSAFNESLVTDKAMTQQAIVPFANDLLLNNRGAIRCLVAILASSRPRLAASPDIVGDDLARFIQVTGALRTILANRGLTAIADFRDADNLDAIYSLAIGARSRNQTARVNAALILADVIDNSGLCVVLDHLYDPALADDEAGKSGRINLIGVAAVVAPWAYRENFENLERFRAYITPIVSGESDTAQTKRVLANLVERMRFQDGTTNKNQRLPADLRQCYDYVPQWANVSGAQLIYRN